MHMLYTDDSGYERGRDGNSLTPPDSRLLTPQEAVYASHVLAGSIYTLINNLFPEGSTAFDERTKRPTDLTPVIEYGWQVMGIISPVGYSSEPRVHLRREIQGRDIDKIVPAIAFLRTQLTGLDDRSFEDLGSPSRLDREPLPASSDRVKEPTKGFLRRLVGR